ncbi:nitrilase-related carbon-nitrogen hydrolase [Actinosynnema sp. CS-041913]|uniref:nitrilase-related carbon-nitrogen hydrolase n=1 Tax=Actinosynnema sp. CS-041913 TaxID=3239917 RepID=UPI003D8C9A1E
MFGTRTVVGTSGSKSRFAPGMPVIDRAPAEVPWWAGARLITLCLVGRPVSLKYCLASFLLGRTRKPHIPRTAGYHEDRYFHGGPADGEPYPVVDLPYAAAPARIGLPTCWDQWFPEVARAYSVNGAEVIAYPTAIGSEPDHPDFDTEPLWRQVIVANGIANGTFMVVANRWGDEGSITFYGSSFVSDPYGRVPATAPRHEDAVLVAPLDLDQRRDWLTLFPFLDTRRPDTYGVLTRR